MKLEQSALFSLVQLSTCIKKNNCISLTALLKTTLFYIILLFSISTFGQASYIDSLQNAISNLPKKKQLKKIVEIPYDKFVGEISKSEKLINSAANMAIELKDSLSLADIYFKLSQISAYKDKSEDKVDYILKSIRIYENLGKILNAGVAYGQLGYAIKWDNMDKAFYYMRKSIKLIESTKNTTLIDPVYDNYGTLHLLNKNPDSALYFHKKSLTLKKQLNDNVGLGFGYANMAYNYAELKKYNIAKKYIDSSLVVRQKLNDNYGIAVCYTHTGDLYFAQKKHNESIINFKISLNQAHKYNYSHLEKYCAEMITNSYLELNDYKNAFNYNKISQNLKDSVVNVQTNTRVAELQIEFETEKKEKEIAQQKEQLLKNELQLKNKTLFTFILGAGLLIFGIISFALFKRQQHKKREFSNQIALKEAQTYSKLQDQRLRISRDLHDNIGSQLTFIISSIDNLNFLTKTSNEKLRAKLSEINEFASSTISQLRDTIWAMNKNEISFEDFQGRILTFIEKAKTIATTIHFNFNSTVKSAIVFSSIKGINIFRVLQEAINNTIKYANASEISIAISETENKLIFIISDNGKGFDINTIELGNGLENMQQRIQEIEGEINFNSEINKGTTITITCLKNRSNAL